MSRSSPGAWITRELFSRDPELQEGRPQGLRPGTLHLNVQLKDKKQALTVFSAIPTKKYRQATLRHGRAEPRGAAGCDLRSLHPRSHRNGSAILRTSIHIMTAWGAWRVRMGGMSPRTRNRKELSGAWFGPHFNTIRDPCNPRFCKLFGFSNELWGHPSTPKSPNIGSNPPCKTSPSQDQGLHVTRSQTGSGLFDVRAASRLGVGPVDLTQALRRRPPLNLTFQR